MDEKTMTARLEAACDELGLHRKVAERLASDVLGPELSAERATVNGLTDRNEELSAELRQLRAEREKLHTETEQLRSIQAEMMTLLNAKSPARLVHELRNVLNELTLLKALAGEEQ